MAGRRNRSVDLLKLSCMLMVVLYHATGWGMANSGVSTVSAVNLLRIYLNTLCLAAVNCFVLITGYHLSEVKPGKVLRLWLQVFTYSVGVYLAVCLIPGTGVTFSLGELVRCALPVLSEQYWFFNCYLILILLAPFLNRLTDTMEQKEYRRMLAVLLVLFCLIPSVNLFGDSFGTAGGYSFIWFCVVYLLGRYLRRWPMKRRPYGWYFLALGTVLFLIRGGGAALGGPVEAAAELLKNYNSPIVTAGAVCLFQFALQGRESWGRRADRAISKLAGLSFGVYLIHDHDAVRAVLWHRWVRLEDVCGSLLPFLGRLTLAAAAIFLAGLAAEQIRQWLMTPLTKRLK